jgi:hypothetical protein
VKERLVRKIFELIRQILTENVRISFPQKVPFVLPSIQIISSNPEQEQPDNLRERLEVAVENIFVRFRDMTASDKRYLRRQGSLYWDIIKNVGVVIKNIGHTIVVNQRTLDGIANGRIFEFGQVSECTFAYTEHHLENQILQALMLKSARDPQEEKERDAIGHAVWLLFRHEPDLRIRTDFQATEPKQMN